MTIQHIKELIWKAKYEEALRSIDKLDELKKLWGSLLKCWIFILKEETDNALSLATESLQKNKALGKNVLHLGFGVIRSYALLYLGQLDDADLTTTKIENTLEDILEKKDTDKLEWEGLLYDIKSRIFWMKGELDPALVYSQRALTIFEGLELEFHIARSISFISVIFRSQGNLNESIEYLERSLTIAKAFNYPFVISYSLHLLGVTYFYSGDLETALDYLRKSQLIDEDVEKFDQISCTIFHIILINLEMDEREKAQEYLIQLNVLNEKDKDNDFINLRKRLAEALILKASKRTKYKADAQRMLETIVNGKIIENQLTVFAMVHLCELLLDELKLYGELEVLEEVEKLSKRIFQIAQDQRSFYLVVESLLLRSRFALIRGDVMLANSLLEQAHLTAVDQNLNKFMKKVISEKKNLEHELQRYLDLIQKGSPIRERIEQLRLNEYFLEMKKFVKSHK